MLFNIFLSITSERIFETFSFKKYIFHDSPIDGKENRSINIDAARDKYFDFKKKGKKLQIIFGWKN